MLRTDCDFAQLTKNVRRLRAVRYFRCEVLPTTHLGFISKVRQGDPDPDHISTSFVERQNLTMRMNMRRFTRLTNAFSKKIDNLRYSVAIHFMHYNFCRIHQTLRVTPAMEAGIADHVWTVGELVSLLNKQEQLAA